MKRKALFFMVVACAVIALPLVLWGQAKNLSVNQAVTAQIRAFDKEFFKGFDVYTAGTDENPTALLFDMRDNYNIASWLWGDPLTEAEIMYAIPRLDNQYRDRKYDIPFAPRALNIVNSKGEILGYIYTGITHVLMDRKKDGRVIVFLPTLLPYESQGSSHASTAPHPK
jgi:hypothetical protein